MYDFLNDAQFPTFRKFTADDYSPYRIIYEKFYTPYADVSLPNLLAWLDIDHTLEISLLNKTVILRYSNPFEHNQRNYLLLALAVSKQDIQSIYALDPNTRECIIREQPRAFLSNLEHDPEILLTTNRDAYEYILDVQQHASLVGGLFYRQRYEVKAFERDHTNSKIEMRMTLIASRTDKQILRDLLATWHLTANAPQSSKENREREALHRAIDTLDILKRPFAILYIDDRPAAFSLFAFYNDTAIVGHVKVDYSLRFIFDYTVHRLAKLFAEHSIRYINFEQDLGINGLRLHKSRLRPIRMLEKVDVTLRSETARSADS